MLPGCLTSSKNGVTLRPLLSSVSGELGRRTLGGAMAKRLWTKRLWTERRGVWRRGGFRTFAAGVAAAALSACVEQVDGPAAYAADQCRATPLVDVATGERVIGAEDLAVDRRSGRLFVSAYDRRSVERAVRRSAFLLPEGGLYSVPIAALAAEEGRLVAAEPLVSRHDAPGGLRPHGLDFDPVTNEIAFINRGYQKINGRWRRSARIERVRVEPSARPSKLKAQLNGEALRRRAARHEWAHEIDASILTSRAVEAPCAANDVLSIDGASLVSFDHANCGWRAFAEDALGLARSGVSAERGAPLFDDVSFANGVARAITGELALAATREKALVLLDDGPDGLAESRRVDLPGGPDNVTVSADGGMVAAVHPSLPWMGAHRHLGLPRAPSRIVKVSPETLDVSLLFEDLRGDHFPGATVAVETDGMLILGSATAEGLFVCRRPGRTVATEKAAREL